MDEPHGSNARDDVRPEEVGRRATEGQGEPFRLLFVCTGNTCRSPMAGAIARRTIEERGWRGFEVRSAGIAAWPGAPASGGALRTTSAHGLDLDSHRSTLLDPELVAWADLVLTMSPAHMAHVEALGGAGKAAVITRFAEQGDDQEARSGVRDPIGGDDREYEATFEQLSELVAAALRRLAPIVAP